jgi:outer membrane immunogenic protein
LARPIARHNLTPIPASSRPRRRVIPGIGRRRVSGRIGLLCLTDGAALGDHKYDGVIHAFGIAHPSGDVIKVGWSAGIGTEWMFAYGWTAKLEYLFADLRSETFAVNAFPKVSVTGHLTEDMIRLGLNYRLGW